MSENPRDHDEMRRRRYKRFFEVVDMIVDEIQVHHWDETGTTKRRLQGELLRKLTVSVEHLVRDSVAVVLQRQRKGEAVINLNTNWYSSPAAPSDLTHSIHVQRAFRGMNERGYLKISKKGIYDRQGRKNGSSVSRLTRYQATDKLIEKLSFETAACLPVIVPPRLPHAPIRIRLVNEIGQREMVACPQTDDAVLMAKSLNRINKILASRWYDLEISDDEMADLQDRLSNAPDGGKQLALDHRSLHRVFNDMGMKTGGRFYGGWWQNIPKAYRRHLTVNGKRMVELDYSNLHPVILYGEVRTEPPRDCYQGIFGKDVETRGGTEMRGMIKSAFNAMLNAEKPLRQAPSDVAPARFGLNWRVVSDAILAAHEPIAHFFYTGAGRRLQRTDSDVAEQVMLAFADRGIPILPVHDSFLVHEGHQQLLEEQMHFALQSVCGIKTSVKLVQPNLDSILAAQKSEMDQDPEAFGPPTTTDLYELLAYEQGNEKRLNAFFSLYEVT